MEHAGPEAGQEKPAGDLHMLRSSLHAQLAGGVDSLHGEHRDDCSCLPRLMVARSDQKEHAGQDAAQQQCAGDLQMFSAYPASSR